MEAVGGRWNSLAKRSVETCFSNAKRLWTENPQGKTTKIWGYKWGYKIIYDLYLVHVEIGYLILLKMRLNMALWEETQKDAWTRNPASSAGKSRKWPCPGRKPMNSLIFAAK